MATEPRPTTPLTDAEVIELVAGCRDQAYRGETPRVTLSDNVVNDLAERARNGNELARELVVYWGSKLIAPHPQHIQWVKYASVSPEDMWQEGRVAVLLAIGKYDRSRGYDFGAYASKIVTNTLGEWAEKNSLSVPVPRHARRRLRREGVVDETTRLAKMAENLTRYLSTLTSTSEKDGPESAIDVMPERADAFNLQHEVERADLATIIRQAFLSLDPDLQFVLRHRYVLGETVDKIHRQTRWSMGKVRATEHEAIYCLADLLEEYLADEHPYTIEEKEIA